MSAAAGTAPPPMTLAPRALTGRQKAAILCLTLGREHTERLTNELTPDESEQIRVEMARIGQVDPDVAEAVLSEWVEMALANDAVSAGGIDYARKALEHAVGPQRAEAILSRVLAQRADVGGIDRLERADPKQVVNLFRDEHPQTVALMLAHMQPTQAASILKEMGVEVSADIIVRVAGMQKVSPDMLSIVERALGSSPDFDFQHGVPTAGGPAAVAAVLNLLQGPLEKALLDRIAMEDSDLAERIKNLMFVFEDLRRVDDRALQRLLRDVDTKLLAVALKGASAELRQRVVSQMSQRAAAALNDEMELLGPTRMREVEAAQAGVITQARALEAAGELVLLGSHDDAVIA